MRVFYMAHPIAGDVAGNLARAKRWLAYLLEELPGIIVIAPWIHDLEALPLRDGEPADRARGLERCAATAAICDGVVLVGGRISQGMALEAARAREVLDLTHLGPEPPDDGPRAA